MKNKNNQSKHTTEPLRKATSLGAKYLSSESERKEICRERKRVRERWRERKKEQGGRWCRITHKKNPLFVRVQPRKRGRENHIERRKDRGGHWRCSSSTALPACVSPADIKREKTQKRKGRKRGREKQRERKTREWRSPVQKRRRTTLPCSSSLSCTQPS